MGIFGWFFRKRKREIFEYWDGKKKRRVDPLLIEYSLFDDPVWVWERHPLLCAAKDRDQAREAMEICLTCYRRVFEIKPYDDTTGVGLTAEETLQVMEDFCNWWIELKKNSNNSQTQQPPTDATLEESSEPTTPDSSDSTPTPNAQNSERSTE